MGHKLSILPRQYDKTGWHKSKQFNVSDIQGIKVDNAGQNKSLNAIPSPFARMHLFETAFEMVFQDLINNTALSGETYQKIISDCFDVFELIYNWETHTREGKNLEIITWKKEQEIYALQRSVNKKHQFLGATLDTFLNGETAFRNFEKCLILKYNGMVVAGTSPFTGYFTTPDDLSNFRLLKPLSQITYFSRTIPFELRKPEIRKYIYDFFELNDDLKSSASTAAIRDFLEWHRNRGNIPAALPLSLRPVYATGTPVTIFGDTLLTATSIGTHYFEPYLIRLKYRLNADCFQLPYTANTERMYDYLLPLTHSFFEDFDHHKIKEIVSIIEVEPGTVQVTIEQGGNKVSKEYQNTLIHDQDGKIIDLFDDHKINFNLAIFPFLKVTGQPEGVDYNDFFRIMVTIQDLSYKFSNKDFQIRFGKDGKLIESGPIYQIRREERTVHEENKNEVGSFYYALNTDFDFMQVQFPAIGNGRNVNGVIALKWKETKLGDHQMDFAIDFGTTSTFIAYTDDPNHSRQPRPLELNEKENPVVLLNKPKNKTADVRWIDCFEGSLNGFLHSIAIQKQEFVPSIIMKREKYEFPIRTVLFQQKSIAANQKELLLNANISFIYQREDAATMSLIGQEFVPNLKWNISRSGTDSSVRIFIEELFMLIRTKILANGGHPGRSKIYWFSPLSFTPASKRAYTELWNTTSSRYLKPVGGNNIFNLTESEAPFYYLFRNAKIDNIKTVLTLDIGGGSTDLMLFNESQPAFGTSVNFGANVIWGNGFSNFSSEKSNGIYLSLKQEIAERLISTSLKKINEDCTNEEFNFGSDEIINFWISNDTHTGILSLLNNGRYRFSYLLHLCALIYHSLKLIRTNAQPAPTCVIFSGNGSKYIDLIDESRVIEKIWGYFIRKIFMPNAANPQVILPENNRKEATCYGGLFASDPPVEIATENYLGFEKPGEQYRTYREIEDNKEQIFANLISSFTEFIHWFFEMNDTVELNFRRQFGIEINQGAIKKFLLEKAEENLREGYSKRRDQVNKDDIISDSLFFYPFVGLIYKVNKLTEYDINNLIDRTTIFAGNPDAENVFLLSKTSMTPRADSIYTIIFENGDTETGVLSIIDDPRVHRMALSVYQGSLNPACNYRVFPQPGQSIKVVAPGKVRKVTDKWIVEEKVQIEFV